MTNMQCQIDIPQVSGLKDQELTVGREFYLSCKGEWPKNLVQEKLQLVLPEAAKYQIHLLGFEFRSPDTADLKVTSYKAAPVKFENLQLTDGTQTIDLGPVQYQVQTVIEKPKDPEQKTEAYGPIGPAKIPVPTLYILILLGVILLVVALAARKIYRVTQRRRLFAKLREHDSALAPLPQLHQSMRKLQRDNPIFFGAKYESVQIETAFDELNRMLRLFLTRELHVPAFDWSDKLILSDLKKYHQPVYEQHSLELKKLLREYTQALKNKSTLNDKDILVLAEQTRKLAEKIDLLKNRGGRKMSFASAISFWLLLLVAAVVFWSLFRRRQRTPTLQFSSIAIFKGSHPSLKTRLMHLPLLLKTLALVFAIIALARPQEANTKVKKNVEGIDIVIALDVSDSMLIEDMKPLNRVEAAKDTIKQFVEKRTSDRIGLVIFAGESFTMVPPTLDYPMLLSRVSEITTAASANIKDGTAIGVAIANAAGRLKDSTAKSRVMVFMTDGENNSGTIDPETGLSIAKGYGIKIYSIGIGKDGPTKIPIYQRDIFGNKVKTYQPFDSTVNENLLSQMASETGGKYYRASKEDSLPKIFKDIDQLEKTKIDVNKFTRYAEKFPPYLMTALILYLLSWFLGGSVLRRYP